MFTIDTTKWNKQTDSSSLMIPMSDACNHDSTGCRLKPPTSPALRSVRAHLTRQVLIDTAQTLQSPTAQYVTVLNAYVLLVQMSFCPRTQKPVGFAAMHWQARKYVFTFKLGLHVKHKGLSCHASFLYDINPSHVYRAISNMMHEWFHLIFSVFALQVLHQTFPQHTFLMNGLIHGVKVRDNSINKQQDRINIYVNGQNAVTLSY